jgi:hypothetical protein
MEFGAFFILVIVLGVVILGGGLVLGVAARLRRAKLDPREDRLDRDDSPRERPEHIRVSSDQRAKFLPGG